NCGSGKEFECLLEKVFLIMDILIQIFQENFLISKIGDFSRANSLSGQLLHDFSLHIIYMLIIAKHFSFSLNLPC
ncbi:hypothetical protein ACJX0J_014613, partial [Zea mays]